MCPCVYRAVFIILLIKHAYGENGAFLASHDPEEGYQEEAGSSGHPEVLSRVGLQTSQLHVPESQATLVHYPDVGFGLGLGFCVSLLFDYQVQKDSC